MNNFELKQKLFALRVRAQIDPRVTPCSVSVRETGGEIVVSGFTGYQQTDTCVRNIAAEVFTRQKLRFDLKVLSRDYKLQFFEVAKSGAPFYKMPRVVKKDLLTEALYGSVIRGYFHKGTWTFAQHPDGYVGYVPRAALRPADADRYLRWKNGEYAILLEPLTAAGVKLAPGTRLISEGNRVQLVNRSWIRIAPGKAHRILPGDPKLRNALLKTMKSFSKTPYLWGGKTDGGIDCSGFAQTLMQSQHVLLPRDASMQAYVGEMVGILPDKADLLPGDLVFFMKDTGTIYHVGVYVGKGCYIHSSGKRNVLKSAFAENGENHMPNYSANYVYGRRVCIR
ncbi:MAG: C40 family peptidase [Candidatus Sumerlaeaceae bacterium]|nr:C40 family peptidase [Candidatus Sumerlaeaceae bacterium]